MPKELVFYNRDNIVNFMSIIVNGTTFNRMKGFTSGENSSNAETDETKYIDEPSTRKRVTGYAKEIAYEADRIVGDMIHNFLSEVEILEKTNINVEIVTVDFNIKKGTGYYATKRIYSVIPDSSGGDENKYTISGTFGANGDIIVGTATPLDNANSIKNISAVSFQADGDNAVQLVTFNVSDADGQVQGAEIIVDTNNTIYTDANGIANINLAQATYSNVEISKEGYTTQSEVSVVVGTSAVYKGITLVEA
mgnify:FL=1